LQVVDSTERSIELRALMTAEDAPTAWDLRCEVREALISWLQEHHPEALPRVRVSSADASELGSDGHRDATRRERGIVDLGTLESSQGRG
jgi:erythromycin esterase-like protein